MNPFQLTFTLKQHTPIIHFQHEQAGATLRATELKPALDAWLRNELKHVDAKLFAENESLISQLPIRGELNQRVTSPFRVTVSIDPGAKQTKFLIGSYIPRFQVGAAKQLGFQLIDRAPYFANNDQIKRGDFSNVRSGLMLEAPNEVKVKFTFLDSKWHRLLSKAFPLFLVTQNFGTRKGKGFGCYQLKDVSQGDFEVQLKKVFGVAYKSNEFRDMEQLFQGIERVYKILKSGVQMGPESELRNYFNRQHPPIEWEKPAMQRAVGKIARSDLKIEQRAQEVMFVRALLGLAEVYEYPHFDGIKVQVRSKAGIDRYASPILFKVHGRHAYLIPNMKQQVEGEFFFHFKHRQRDYGEMVSLKVPEGFDLKKFLQWAMFRQKTWREL